MGRSLHLLRVKVFFLDFFLDEQALSNCDFKSESDDECVHFVEFAVVGTIDHTVSEEFYPFAEVVVEGGVYYFLVTSCGEDYKRKKKTSRMSW